jgi:putative ABC transport system substrate-binding protein
MRRRQFLTLFGSAAAWPLAARAQQPGGPVIGYLSGRSAATDVPLLAAFRQGLGSIGYVEGRNVTIEYRFADSDLGRTPSLAQELARGHVAVIVTGGSYITALAGKAASATIPIVFNTGADPVQAGLVSSINRPGGNVTGVFLQNTQLIGKMMGLLHDLVPNAKTIGVLANPASRLATEADAQGAAATLGLKVSLLRARSEGELEATFANLAKQPADAMLIPNDPLFLPHAGRIVELVAQHALPTIYGRRPYAEAGGLMSYGADAAYGYRQAGIYAGRILQGAKPADLPVMLTEKFELVINLKTAQALGLSVSRDMLLIADEVIE